MGEKMDKTTKIVLAVVGSFGVLSALLGFAGEGTKITVNGMCYYPRNSALALGVCAALFLIVAQVIFAVVGGCCGCCKSRDAAASEKNRIVIILCAVFSWVAAVIAFSLFVMAADSNPEGYREEDALGQCFYLKDGIFAGAGVLALAATALGLTSYVLLRKQQLDAAPGGPPKAGGGIAMGQPQFPQQPPPQGYGQAPPPYYPQHSPSPPPQGYGQAPSPYYPQHHQGHAQV